MCPFVDFNNRISVNLRELNKSRENLDLQLLIGVATDDELFEQIEIEIGLFEQCYKIIEVRIAVFILSYVIFHLFYFKLKREDADNHKKLFLLMLFDRINTLFAYLFHLFPINANHVQKYMQLCSNHVSIN